MYVKKRGIPFVVAIFRLSFLPAGNIFTDTSLRTIYGYADYKS